MKRSDIYPEPDDGGANLPRPMKILGLHPLVWVFIVIMGIAGFGAYDHLEDADWDHHFFGNDDAENHDD